MTRIVSIYCIPFCFRLIFLYQIFTIKFHLGPDEPHIYENVHILPIFWYFRKNLGLFVQWLNVSCDILWFVNGYWVTNG